MRDREILWSAVFILLISDGKVLLHRRKNTGWHNGDYDAPSGHVRVRESFAAAACREAKEETGVMIDKRDLQFVTTHHGYYAETTKNEWVYVCFATEKWQGEPKIIEPEKCDEMRWFDLDDLPKNLTPGARDALKAYEEKIPFSESGF